MSAGSAASSLWKSCSPRRKLLSPSLAMNAGTSSAEALFVKSIRIIGSSASIPFRLSPNLPRRSRFCLPRTGTSLSSNTNVTMAKNSSPSEDEILPLNYSTPCVVPTAARQENSFTGTTAKSALSCAVKSAAGFRRSNAIVARAKQCSGARIADMLSFSGNVRKTSLFINVPIIPVHNISPL